MVARSKPKPLTPEELAEDYVFFETGRDDLISIDYDEYDDV